MIKDYYRSADLSKMFGVTIATIGNWIKDGSLKASTTAGGHYRFKPEDIVACAKVVRYQIPSEFKDSVTTSLGKYKIMVIDDGKIDINMVRDILKDLFLNNNDIVGIDTANNPFTVGMKLAEYIPDIIILDKSKKGGPGSAIFKEIKENNKYRNIKILDYSKYSKEELQAEIKNSLRI